MRRKAPAGAPKAFLAQAVESDTDDCIEWPFGKIVGYGSIVIDGKQHLVHRVVCERAYGPPPVGAVAAHAPVECHNRACVNPRHLRWATRKENAEDAITDGMTTRGERSPHAKLTAQDVRDIRAALAAGELQKDIAARYEIHQVTVSDIKTGDRWGWLAA